mmetsp:Transcript_15760/g.32634  ORF Transcript_15760/g.32634 Transcript_15760/m.32634 type:complete len:249 (-) Transcript_15760:1168-1914(-)
MLEMSNACGEQGHVVLVAALDGIAVSDAAAWVDDGLHSGLAGLLDRVVPREWEEGVAGHDRALDLIRRLLDRNLHALHAVGLPRPHAQKPLALGDGDGVRLDVLHAPPSELQVLQLLLGGLNLGNDLEGDIFRIEVVVVLHNEAAADLLHASAVLVVVGLRLEDPQRLALSLERLQALLRVTRRDHDLVEHPRLAVLRAPELPDLLGKLLCHWPVECHDAAKRTDRISLHRPPVSLPQILRVVLPLVG